MTIAPGSRIGPLEPLSHFGRDGQRFLVNTPTEETNTSPITVVLNWKAELKKK